MITRRRFLGLAGVGVGASVGSGLVGWRTGGLLPRVREQVLTLPGLPPAFDGIAILLVTDVHAGARMDATRMGSLVDVLVEIPVDVAVLGGDMVDFSADLSDIQAWAAAFRRLEAPEGVVGVTGNHEYMAGIDPTMREITAAGFDFIRGGHRLVERGGDALSLLGVDDPDVLEFDPPQDDAVADALDTSPHDAFPILLAHRPAAFDAALRFGIPLTLSGHTHGGQVGLPWRDLTPVRSSTRYVRGVYESDGSALVVSEGVGTGSFPLRIGVPPAVSRVVLRAA